MGHSIRHVAQHPTQVELHAKDLAVGASRIAARTYISHASRIAWQYSFTTYFTL